MNTKCEVIGSANYAAIVVAVEQLVDLEGLDRLKGLRTLGYQAIVGKDTPIGSKMIVFVAGSQLSPDYTAANNLYRHGTLNADTTASGYLEDNRRVKALRLKKNQSDALAMPIASLFPVLGYVPDLPVGAQFDTIDGKLICQRFQLRPERVKGANFGGSKTNPLDAVPDEVFPEHYDTAQYNRCRDRYDPSDHVIVSQKLHGTSVRFGRVPVARQLTLIDKIARFFGAQVLEMRDAFVVGSRRVTKSIDGESNPVAHYYADDLWSSSVSNFIGRVPSGFVVYGELIGWTPSGSAIQPNYTYNLTVGHNELYVYRVTSINEDGDQYDLSWRDMERFCDRHGMKVVPVLFRGTHAEFESRSSEFIDRKFFPDLAQALALSDPRTVDEGVCIASQHGVVTKFKSPIFLGHESALMDNAAPDIEEEQAAQ